MVIFFFRELTDLSGGDDPCVHVRPHFGKLLDNLTGDLASGDLIRVILNGQIRVRRGWGGGRAWCVGGVVEAQRTQGTHQLEV